jgi:nucleoside-diphosphate-sugar epimerase
MRTLVTGANGFAGHYLVDFLANFLWSSPGSAGVAVEV